jgi:hypothetical protein
MSQVLIHRDIMHKDWDWNSISRNIGIQDIIDNPHLPWSKRGLSLNKDINSIIDIRIPNAIDQWITSLVEIELFHNYRPSQKYNISMEYIRSHINEEYNLRSLSYNINLEIDIIELDLPNTIGEWNYYSVCSMPKIHISDFRTLLKYCTRKDLSNNIYINIYWMNFIDKVGLTISKWKSDISIICCN